MFIKSNEKIPAKWGDILPFRALAIGDSFKVYDPALWTLARRRAADYEARHLDFFFKTKMECETKLIGQKFVPVHFLRVRRVVKKMSAS